MCCTDVATPADYEIPFENLELVASDGVLVKAYLMKQRKTLVGHAPEMSDNIPPSEQTDDEVPSNFRILIGDMVSQTSQISMQVPVRPSCFSTRMPEMSGIDYPSDECSTSK